jgi:hypothetical protein
VNPANYYSRVFTSVVINLPRERETMTIDLLRTHHPFLDEIKTD